ncbi:unnamed protein product [Lupinus luteus]|uniref:WRKY domain-containing protein n=1 Tax=Lupinus luteus TaxID=3873 RepID=A0AAV1Y0E2_LUPLU
MEGSLYDGYSWRKYGQKDILRAMYPRGYYKCTNRNVQGCLATKQVQRSDEDPTIFEITYTGMHTCTMASNTFPISTPNENQESNFDTIPQQQNNILQSLEHQPNPNELGLRVQTENLDSSLHDPSFASIIKSENQIIPPPMLENFTSPSYINPATSGISHFSVSPSLASSEFRINDMNSAATSVANSPTVGLESPFDQFEFDSHFTFDNPRFF